MFSRVESGQQRALASSFATDTPAGPDPDGAPVQGDLVEPRGFFTRTLEPGASDQSPIRALLLIDRAEALQAYYALAIEIALLTLGALLVAGLLVLLLARALGRPVLELARFAVEIGEDRDTSPPRRSAVGELALLRDALRDMKIGIQNRERRIRHDAEHDELTDLPNRKAVEKRLAHECARETPLTVIAVSIHGFKTINETLGFRVSVIRR